MLTPRMSSSHITHDFNHTRVPLFHSLIVIWLTVVRIEGISVGYFCGMLIKNVKYVAAEEAARKVESGNRVFFAWKRCNACYIDQSHAGKA